ncbi:MAG: hypothetical protein AAF488_10275 [Planctomycetota bacterium]
MIIRRLAVPFLTVVGLAALLGCQAIPTGPDVVDGRMSFVVVEASGGG